jgi:exosome complex component RRP40
MGSQIVFPGEVLTGIEPIASKAIHPASGLFRETLSSPLTSTVAGILEPASARKKYDGVSTPRNRYIPQAGDLVLAQVQRSSADFYHLSLNPHSPSAILPQLAFEGASKKTRPQLKANDLVYAKVLSANRNMEVELTCVDPATGKAEPDGLGPITGGMVFEISTDLAAHILGSQKFVVLEELGAKLAGGFEVAVAKNGKVWVDCAEAGTRGVCAIGRCLQGADQNGLSENEQKKLVNASLREMGLG